MKITFLSRDRPSSFEPRCSEHLRPKILTRYTGKKFKKKNIFWGSCGFARHHNPLKKLTFLIYFYFTHSLVCIAHLFFSNFSIRVQGDTYKHSICIWTHLFIHIYYTCLSFNITRWKEREKKREVRCNSK